MTKQRRYGINGMLLNCQKSEILPFVTTWMDLENIKLSEISQTEKVKNYMISLMWNLNQKATNKINTNSQTCKSKVVIRGRGW